MSDNPWFTQEDGKSKEEGQSFADMVASEAKEDKEKPDIKVNNRYEPS
jgi:hypothetical protein